MWISLKNKKVYILVLGILVSFVFIQVVFNPYNDRTVDKSCPPIPQKNDTVCPTPPPPQIVYQPVPFAVRDSIRKYEITSPAVSAFFVYEDGEWKGSSKASYTPPTEVKGNDVPLPPTKRTLHMKFDTELDKGLHMHSLSPIYFCSNEERVGGLGDGGKFVCRPREIPSPCIVYSFGSQLNFAFEYHIMELTPCEVHTFDPTPSIAHRAAGMQFPARLKYHGYGLSGADTTINLEGQNVPAKTIETIMKELGHTHVDIMKIDIEGHEFDGIFNTANDSAWYTRVGQMQIEIHFFIQGGPNEKILKIFNTFEETLKWKCFHAEVNPYHGQAWEYAFINPNYKNSAGEVYSNILAKPYSPELIAKSLQNDMVERNRFYESPMNNPGAQARTLEFLLESTDQVYHCNTKTIIGEIFNGGVYWCDTWRKNRGNLSVLSIQAEQLSPNLKKDTLTTELKSIDKSILSSRWTFEKQLTEMFPNANLEIVTLSSLDWDTIFNILDSHNSLDVLFFNMQGNDVTYLPTMLGAVLKRLGVKQIMVNCHYCGNGDYRLFQRHFSLVENLHTLGYPLHHKDGILYDIFFWRPCRYHLSFAVRND